MSIPAHLKKMNSIEHKEYELNQATACLEKMFSESEWCYLFDTFSEIFLHGCFYLIHEGDMLILYSAHDEYLWVECNKWDRMIQTYHLEPIELAGLIHQHFPIIDKSYIRAGTFQNVKFDTNKHFVKYLLRKMG